MLIRGELGYLKLNGVFPIFELVLINLFPLFQLMALCLHPVLYRFSEFGYTQMSQLQEFSWKIQRRHVKMPNVNCHYKQKKNKWNENDLKTNTFYQYTAFVVNIIFLLQIFGKV